MGKYSGKLLTIYLAPDGVRVCEGENRNGDPNIIKFFVVGGVEEYFARGTSTTPTTITNLSGLVSAIVQECKAHMVNTKRVMICSNSFGLRTTIAHADVVGGVKNLFTGDLKTLRKKKANGPEFEPLPPDKMSCKCNWGELTIQGTVKRMVTRTEGDKFMLKSIVQEFYSHGYDVIYISGAAEALINFRQTEAANFDSQGKIIFDFDIGCVANILVKDIPVSILRMGMPDPSLLGDRVQSMLKQALPITGRNPRIYLMGAVFKDIELYGRLIDQLEDDGYTVYDAFGHPDLPEDYEERVANGEMQPILTPDYAANVALLMAPFTKIMPQLTPTVGLDEVLKKNSQAVATLVLAASILSFVISGGFAIKRFIEMQDIASNPSNLANLQSQVSTLQMRQASLNATIDTLTQADTTVLSIMDFVNANQSDRVCIVSVDTRDMLPSMDVTTTAPTAPATPTTPPADGAGVGTTTPADAAATGDVFSGTSGGPGSVRENIVIRGYAKSDNEAIGWFNKFFNSGLTVDPVFNGVERYELPDGDEVYVFEVEVGAGGDIIE